MPGEDRHRWIVAGLEISERLVAVLLRDQNGVEQTDLLLASDAAACSKLVRRFVHERDRGHLLALPARVHYTLAPHPRVPLKDEARSPSGSSTFAPSRGERTRHRQRSEFSVSMLVHWNTVVME
jgi:hypothetical protein